jgi:hypothetical protein
VATQTFHSKFGFTNGQWGFLILAGCSANLWRIISSTQLLPYDLFFWGHVLVPSLGSICLIAFPFAFQEGFFAKSTLVRLSLWVGFVPLVLAVLQALIFLAIGRIEFNHAKSWLLPYSPIRNEFEGQNYPYTLFEWSVRWFPVVLQTIAGIWLVALILSIPRRVQRTKLLVTYYTFIGFAGILGIVLTSNTYGPGLWGPNPGDSTLALAIVNEGLSLLCGGYLLLKIEKAFRPSLFFVAASGLIGSVYSILIGPTDWNAAGATLISTAICLWIIDFKSKSQNQALLPNDDESLQS